MYVWLIEGQNGHLMLTLNQTVGDIRHYPFGTATLNAQRFNAKKYLHSFITMEVTLIICINKETLKCWLSTAVDAAIYGRFTMSFTVGACLAFRLIGKQPDKT